MGTPVDIIPAKTAAKMLGVTKSTIYWMMREGILSAAPHPQRAPRQERYFRLHDVAALAEARSKPQGRAALLAEQAIAISKSNARRLDELCRVLGLDVAVLETSEEAIVALYLKAEEMLGERDRIRENPKEILEWARAIYAIDENYLKLVHHFTAIEEPWDVFLSLAQRLSEEAPFARFALHKDLEHAYGYLEAARRSIRHVAFFYSRQKTTRIKDVRFDKEEDYTEPIIRLLFPH